jgi:asparagine synthase (glutamine-hydrolysing)
MCGIGGIIRYDGKAVPPEELRRMGEVLAHRGPDDHGFLAWDGKRVHIHHEHGGLPSGQAGMVHRRLSILDLSEAGRQPMSTPDGRYHITFNGEIYNYIELRERLKGLGHTFFTETDTEVLLAAYAEWGRDCLAKLTGMFAFAILDARRRTVFLARDFFGIKPLYFTAAPNHFAFASEIKGLLSLDRMTAAPDAQGLYDYLQHGRILDNVRTVYAGIAHLPPAHCLEVGLDSPGSPKPERYWEIQTDRTLDISFEEAVEETRRLFLENVRLHLRSDVPVGVALSGGVDSSSIAACMRRHSEDLAIHGFSFTPDDHALSEESFVDITGRASSITVHKVRIGPGDLLGDIDTLLGVHDEPFLNTGMYAQYRVMQAAAESGIKVMLDGQGADEMLGGYVRYYGDMAASLIKGFQPFEALRLMWNARNMRKVTPATILAPLLFGLIPRPCVNLLRSAMGKRGVHQWLDEAWFRERDVILQPAPPTRKGKHALRKELKRSLELDLPQLLRYEDRNSMAHSIESRVPFLTPELAQFLFSLPEDFLISPEGETKRVFRHAMRGIVPDPILDRKDKFGFPTPEHAWLDTMRPWLKNVLEGDTPRDIPFMRDNLLATQWGETITPGTFGSAAWRFMSVVKWAETNNIAFNNA